MPRAPRVMLTGRVTETQAAALRAYADEVGLPLYQATVRALELGIAALIGGRGAAPLEAAQDGTAALEREASDAELAGLREAVERLTTRAELTDRLVQRTLYASCASYAAALAELGAEGEKRPERLAAIAEDADRIFDRQLAKAREGL